MPLPAIAKIWGGTTTKGVEISMNPNPIFFKHNPPKPASRPRPVMSGRIKNQHQRKGGRK